jgi:DNA-binding CsgD family transcriptional regulator
VGKTRLLGEAVTEARRRGLTTLIGRSSIAAPASFGVLAEALRSWSRAQAPLPTRRSVYDRGLRFVLPEWPADEGNGSLSESQLRLLALEGVVDLLRDIAAGGGLLLAVEDLHAADPDSIEAVRYIAGADVSGVLIVATLRPGEGALADELVRALDQQGLAEVQAVEPLAAADVADLLSALIDAGPPDALVQDVLARTDGVPLLVEEVVEAHLRAGSLALDDGQARWRGAGNVAPRGVVSMVASRLDRLSDDERVVLVAGSVTGLADLDLVKRVTGMPADVVRRAIARGVDVGLLESVGGVVDFRHAVIGDAARDLALADQLRVWHQRAADALAGERDDDGALERRAHHLEAVGDDDAAAGALVDATTKCVVAGAFLRAEALAERAGRLAALPATVSAAADALAAALAAQGRWADALAVDAATVERDGHTAGRWMRMARGALDGRFVDRARELAATAPNDVGNSPFGIVTSGRLALLDGDAGAALRAATEAQAVAGDDALARTSALDLEARAAQFLGRPDDAAKAWTAAATCAEQAGLAAERLRVLVSLAELELFAGEPPRRMVEVIELADSVGALVEAAWAAFNLSIALCVQGDPVGGLEVATDAVERCRKHRLDLLPFALMGQAGSMSSLGDPEFESVLREACELAGDTPDAILHSRSITTEYRLHVGRIEEALPDLEAVTAVVVAAPGGLPSAAPFMRPLALANLGRLDDARAALDVARAIPNPERWHSCPTMLAVAEAEVAGDEEAADRAFASAPPRMPFDAALLRVLAAETVRGPARARWLREALDLYESCTGTLAVDRVRGLLRDAGGAVPRRRRASLVPPGLIPLGVTAREAEVLQLVEEGLSNAAIAEKLFLSVRTVESHVSSLLTKLAVTSRADLKAPR